MDFGRTFGEFNRDGVDSELPQDGLYEFPAVLLSAAARVMTSEMLIPEQRFALLRRELKWAEEKTDFYRTAFARVGVSHASVNTFADMAQLPFWDDAVKEGADTQIGRASCRERV